MKLTPEQELAIANVANTEPTARCEQEIVELLASLKCPTCGSPLMFGGCSSVFRFVEFGSLNEGWQDGKDSSEGNHFMCSKSERHEVYSIVPEEIDNDISDYLNGLG